MTGGDRAGEASKSRGGHGFSSAADPERVSTASEGPAETIVARAAAGGPASVAAVLRAFPQYRDAMLAWLHRHLGNAFVLAVFTEQPGAATPPGDRREHASATAKSPSSSPPDLAETEHQRAGPSGPGPAGTRRPAETPPRKPPTRGEARAREPNAVFKVVVYGASGEVIRVWSAKGVWEGPLPQQFTGERRNGTWSWDDASAKSVRIDTKADATGGTPVEAWAAQLRGTRILIHAQPIDAVTLTSDAPEHQESRTHAPGHGDDATNIGADRSGGDESSEAGARESEGGDAEAAPESDPKSDEIADEFERELGIHGTPDGDEEGVEESGDGVERTGTDRKGGGAVKDGPPRDASESGSGHGGAHSKKGGDAEAEAAPKGPEGLSTESRDGEEGGSEGGRFGGEGEHGDEGVRGAGALFGGLVSVPEALRGAVELALLVEAGDIIGAAGQLFKKGLGKATTIAAAREIVARESRIAAAKETKAVAKRLASKKAFTSLSKVERDQVLRIVYWESQRRYFRAYLKAARAEQRAVKAALRRAKPGDVAALKTRGAAADAGEELAKVEPVAGRLPQNHAYAGREFPRSALPARFRQQGLKFKDTGYPDFEPHAKTLPNGKKKVSIEYRGSRDADARAANKAAKLERTPRNWTWHHDEAELGGMMLVPSDLHDAVRHAGGVAEYKHRHGVTAYGD